MDIASQEFHLSQDIHDALADRSTRWISSMQGKTCPKRFGERVSVVDVAWREKTHFRAHSYRPGFRMSLGNAQGRNRTADTSLFRAVLYRLSYLRTSTTRVE